MNFILIESMNPDNVPLLPPPPPPPPPPLLLPPLPLPPFLFLPTLNPRMWWDSPGDKQQYVSFRHDKATLHVSVVSVGWLVYWLQGCYDPVSRPVPQDGIRDGTGRVFSKHFWKKPVLQKFLDASSHLYKTVHWSISVSVHRSVCHTVNINVNFQGGRQTTKVWLRIHFFYFNNLFLTRRIQICYQINS